MVGGKLYHWCAKCGDNGLWTLSHSTGDHKEGFRKNKNNGNRSQGQVNYLGEGLVPDARIWLAKFKVSPNDDDMTGRKKRINRPRNSRNKNKKNKSKRNDKRELVVVKDSSSSDSGINQFGLWMVVACLLYTSPSPRDVEESRMPSSA